MRLQQKRTVIRIRDLHHSYPDGTPALRGVHLEIREGERVGLIGPNGAGKTTLLLHLGGLLKGRGTLEVAGLPLNDETIQEIRRAVGLVFQDPEDQLFMPTVFDDVAFGPLNLGLDEATVRERVAEALQTVAMSEAVDRPPHRLSFGEKKRVALATILAIRPRILALDEPTSNLDPRSRRKLIHLLRGIATTTLIATHDLELVLELCPRAILLDRGEVIDDGPARDLLADEGLMRAHGLEVPLSLSLEGVGAERRLA